MPFHKKGLLELKAILNSHIILQKTKKYLKNHGGVYDLQHDWVQGSEREQKWRTYLDKCKN